MLKLSGYQEANPIYTGTRTLVYRTIRTTDSKPVIIKVLRNPQPNFNELVTFRNQYIITRHLKHPTIVQPLALERYGNGYLLVMPDDGSMALSDYWQQSNRNLREFLNIAIQIAEALHYLTQQRIIHKDIKPTNILIHPETKQVKLIDFSISSLLPKEQQQLINPNILEGTLAYISPEQTGRMNRGIDYRTDFYSLGVTFFQLLSGKLPFESNDPMELVHCHIAQVVNFPASSSVPGILQAIVLKLMAKNAEDRYQSALGLKHDLEQCLQKLDTKGTIEIFELGERDRSDRFLIPEKLYGRDMEVQTLLDAFERVAQTSSTDLGKAILPQSPHQSQSEATSGFPLSKGDGRGITPGDGRGIKKGRGGAEMMLVAGFSGIGKTAVVNEVHKPIVKQRGNFIKGKFDQFNRNIPFSAFVQAFRDLMGQLLGEVDENLGNWKTEILNAVGKNGQIIIDVIPELEQIIGQQPPIPELSGTAAQNRFNLIFGKFLRVFTTKEHPLVIFLDDLQWADLASLNLLKLLMDDSETAYLLILGAYRDNEVFPAHPLMLTLNEMQKQGANINTLTLAPLHETDITHLVADSLLCSVEIATPLSQLVYQKTNGNPFFTTQFLLGLYEDGWIIFEQDGGYWQCNLTQIRQLALTDDVVQFMVGRLRKLPQATQEVLKLAACIGNEFDLATLAVVCESTQEEVATDLWRTLSEGFVIPQSESYKFFQGEEGEKKGVEDITVGYRFLHDRVQQAAYSLIPDDRKERTHYHIGQLLLQQIPPEAKEDRIFELVGQLNYGTALITKQTERDELAELNLIASRKARAATAYQAGRQYVNTALSMLGENGWHSQYQMSLSLYELAAELASLCGDFEVMAELSTIVIDHSQSLLDQANIYRTILQANFSQNKLTEAITIALDFLQKLGVTFPETETQKYLEQLVTEIEEHIGDRDIEDLVHLPRMTDNQKVVIVQTVTSIISAAYNSGSPLFALLVSFAVKLSIQYGHTLASPFAYATYGIVACNLLSNVNTGVKFGKLAVQVVSKLDAKTFKTQVLQVVGGFILHRNSHLKGTLPLMQEAYTNAIEVGNPEFAGHSGAVFCLNSFWNNQPLTTVEQQSRDYCHGLEKLNQLTTANYCRFHWQIILNLLGAVGYPTIVSGEALQETEFLPKLTEANDLYGLYLFYLHKLMLYYLFGEIESAVNYGSESKRYLMGGTGTVGMAGFYFYDSLSVLAQLNPEAEDISEALQRIEENQRQLQQEWAHHAPMNHQHKVDLVAAEKFRILGNKGEAVKLYDKAIAGAKTNEYIQEEALANELAAKFYLDWEQQRMASTYMQQAYYCYARWGAKAKISQLEEQYPQLLSSILQKYQPRLKSSYPQSISTVSTTTATFDLESTIKASQAISSEIELEALLSKLMHIVLENAGSDKGALILNNSSFWEIVAECDRRSFHLSSTTIEETKSLPRSIINTVKRTQQAVIINHSTKHTTFVKDPYLILKQPQSLLCTPILNQGKFIGILYLENNFTTEVFTPDRIQVLNFLTAQAAISIENARLYQGLENYNHNLELKVEQRTQQLREKNQHLQQTLRQLEQTQTQLIQTEKMSALGQMVAGIAHEINNPITFIAGNISHARSYFHDLLNLLALYEQNSPDLSTSIRKQIEELEVEFLQDDLEKLFNSMENGSNRIRKIILGLRNFSRLDESERKQVDIHAGLEHTLMILQHRLKANTAIDSEQPIHECERPEIIIVKNYGKLPLVNCYASQLNQVFWHIITNAIDALTMSEVGDGPEIGITTEMQGEQTVRIRIADNGLGMSQSIRQRIFDPFFTTKPVGQGTGLGLSISYQIITEQHGGKLECISQPGKGTEFIIDIPI